MSTTFGGYPRGQYMKTCQVENCRLGANGGPFRTGKVSSIYKHLRDDHLGTAISTSTLRNAFPNLGRDQIKFPEGYAGPVWMIKGFVWAEHQLISVHKGFEPSSIVQAPSSPVVPVGNHPSETILNIIVRIQASQPRKLHCPECGCEMMIQVSN